MLTETQFKVLMILFDDKGHAGWQLAEALGMEESNLNPLLKRLEKANFIFQGPPRKSNRPKKLEKIKKREGDYKEFPYFLKKDLNILGSVIKEMVVTNTSYDIGFPYRIIRASNYMRSMRETFKDNFNLLLEGLCRELNIRKIGPTSEALSNPNLKIRELHLLSFREENPQICEEQVSEESLKELEIWWLRYEFGMFLKEDPVNISELLEIKRKVPNNCILGDDIREAIREAIIVLREN